MEESFSDNRKKRMPANLKTIFKIVILIIVILVIFAVGYLIRGRIQSNNWQAVFLGDGQVYFGKIEFKSYRELGLKNIYYLKAPASGQVNVNSEQKFTLVKLGNEIHGPKDKMTINRDYVVLIEELKDDSKVVQSINSFIAEDSE